MSGSEKLDARETIKRVYPNIANELYQSKGIALEKEEIRQVKDKETKAVSSIRRSSNVLLREFKRKVMQMKESGRVSWRRNTKKKVFKYFGSPLIPSFAIAHNGKRKNFTPEGKWTNTRNDDLVADAWRGFFEAYVLLCIELNYSEETVIKLLNNKNQNLGDLMYTGNAIHVINGKNYFKNRVLQ